jgi:hypothetical protein
MFKIYQFFSPKMIIFSLFPPSGTYKNINLDTPQQDVYFIFPNGSYLRENFDRAIIMNYGYIEYAWGKYFDNGLIGPPYPNCSGGNYLPDAYKPIGRVLEQFF